MSDKVNEGQLKYQFWSVSDKLNELALNLDELNSLMQKKTENFDQVSAAAKSISNYLPKDKKSS